MTEEISVRRRRVLIGNNIVGLAALVMTWVANALWGLTGLAIAVGVVTLGYVIGLVVIFTKVKRRAETM